MQNKGIKRFICQGIICEFIILHHSQGLKQPKIKGLQDSYAKLFNIPLETKMPRLYHHGAS